MKAELTAVKFPEIPSTVIKKCTSGKWHHYNRVFVLEKNHHYSVIVMNLFERFIRAIVGDKIFLCFSKKFKNAKILKASSFPKEKTILQQNLYNSEDLLPSEMWAEVQSFLRSPKDLVSTQLVSKQLHASASATELNKQIRFIGMEAKNALEAIQAIKFNSKVRLYFDLNGKLQAFHENHEPIYYRPGVTHISMIKRDFKNPEVVYLRTKDNKFELSKDISVLNDNNLFLVYLVPEWGYTHVGPNENSKFKYHKLVINALFYYANKFRAGVEKISKERSIPKHVVIERSKITSNYSLIWKFSEKAEIPNASRILSNDTTISERERKKFQKISSDEMPLRD